MERRHRGEGSIIPDDVKAVFDELDIEKTWDYLEKTFRLNKAKWKGLFEEHYSTSSREFSKMELYVRFGKQHLEEPICRLLFRDPNYSHTWLGLIRYIVKEKIAEREKEANQKAYKSTYQKGSYHNPKN